MLLKAYLLLPFSPHPLQLSCHGFIILEDSDFLLPVFFLFQATNPYLDLPGTPKSTIHILVSKDGFRVEGHPPLTLPRTHRELVRLGSFLENLGFLARRSDIMYIKNKYSMIHCIRKKCSLDVDYRYLK